MIKTILIILIVIIIITCFITFFLIDKIFIKSAISNFEDNTNVSINIKEPHKLNIIPNLSNTHQIGNVLYTEYILYFQVSGLILLLAMIGAILLTFRKREGVKTQSYINQISREPSSSVEILKVDSNKGVKIDD